MIKCYVDDMFNTKTNEPCSCDEPIRYEAWLVQVQHPLFSILLCAQHAMEARAAGEVRAIKSVPREPAGVR